MNNRANLYHHVLIQVNMMRILNITKSLRFTMSSNMAKRKPGREGTSMFNNTKRVQRSREGAEPLFPRESGISRYNGAMKYKYNNFSHVCWSCKHQLVLLSDSPRTMEDWDGDMLKIVSHGKLLEREVMVHEKCYREYTRLPKDETVSCLKLHIKNVNTKY